MSLYIGWKASEVWHLHTFRTILRDLKVTDSQIKKLAEEEGVKLDDDDNSLPVLDVRIEKHPEGLFAYRKADGFFLAMGKDREGLMENLVANLTNVRVVVAQEDGAELIKSQS